MTLSIDMARLAGSKQIRYGSRNYDLPEERNYTLFDSLNNLLNETIAYADKMKQKSISKKYSSQKE